MVAMMPPSRQTVNRAMLAEKCRRSFAVFIQEFWHVVEPGTPLIWDWYAQTIADHLQAAVEGKFHNLAIAIPPGFGKSTFVSVMLQPWEWSFNPSIRELYGSYDEVLTHRDSVKARDVIKSKKYQNLFKPDWWIRRDQDSKGFFTNTKHGSRKTYYMGSRKKTGWRGNHVIVDDSLSAEDRYNITEKKAVIDSWDHVLSTRVNRVDDAVFIIIGQRLADDDLIGFVIKKYGSKYVYLMLDPDRRCMTPIFSDPRTERGELLCSQLIGPAGVEEKKLQLGDVDYQAQYQHNPYPIGGTRFESQYFQYWEASGLHQIKIFHRTGAVEFIDVKSLPRFLSVDPACSDKTSADFTVIGLWCQTSKNELILLHRVKLQGKEPAVIAAVRDVFYMRDWGNVSPLFVAFEDNGLGLPISQALESATPGLPILHVTVHKDLTVRSATAIIQIFNGRVFFPSPDQVDWMREFMLELTMFPGGEHDDSVSMVSIAANSIYEQKIPILGEVKPVGISGKPQHDARRNHFDVTGGRTPLFGAGKGR